MDESGERDKRPSGEDRANLTLRREVSAADAVVRAYQRGVTGGTELRLVVTAKIVSRVLSISGVGRLVFIYPSLEAATAAPPPAAALPRWPLRPGRGTNGQAPPHSTARAGRPAQATGPASRAGLEPSRRKRNVAQSARTDDLRAKREELALWANSRTGAAVYGAKRPSIGS